MAISKERKKEIVAEYQEWLKKSQAVIMTGYVGLSMKDMDALRKDLRAVGGEYHILKNTLCKIAFEEAGLQLVDDHYEAGTAAGFAFEDAPGLAKALTDFSNKVEFLTIKGGYLDNQPISADEIKALAALPPLPVMRAQLLGTIMASGNQLARVLVEPARQVVTVLQAYVDQDASEAPA